jgi:citrate synthase
MNPADRGLSVLTAGEAADVLGVRLPTIYAYVSRGVLIRSVATDSAGRRVSHFDREQVLSVARARTRTKAGSLALLLESDVTQLDPRGRLCFRGHDVAELASTMSFEGAADMVWQVPHDDSSWVTPQQAGGDLATHPAFVHDLPLPTDRMQVAVTIGAANDPNRHDLTVDHVARVGRAAIRLMTSAAARYPIDGDGDDTATALWFGATGQRPKPAEHRALTATLICLLDHELTTSTMAARAAAGTHADPWMVLLTGIAAMRGPRQAAASTVATEQLRSWLTTGDVPKKLAGFGHKVYEGPDPRAEIILALVADLDPRAADKVERLAVHAAREFNAYPNVDLALAALTVVCDLPPTTSEVIFTTSRSVGLLAHALEEYPHRLRLRPRAINSHTEGPNSAT